MRTLRGWAASYGDLFRISLPAVGMLAVVADPDAVHGILASDPQASHAGAATRRVLPLLGAHSVLRLDA